MNISIIIEMSEKNINTSFLEHCKNNKKLHF